MYVEYQMKIFGSRGLLADAELNLLHRAAVDFLPFEYGNPKGWLLQKSPENNRVYMIRALSEDLPELFGKYLEARAGLTYSTIEKKVEEN